MFNQETALKYYNTFEKTICPYNLSRGKLIALNPELPL